MIRKLADMYAEIILEIFRALSPIFIIILILTIIKIIFDYVKYGKKAFSVFDKKEDINISEESLKILIDNLNVYYKLIQNDNTIILILECGIYVFYLLDYDGIISGNIKDEKLVLGKDTQKERLIDNPIYILNKKIDEISTKINKEIIGYVLLKSSTIFSVLNRTDIKVIPINAFYYHFSKLVRNKKLSIKEIDEIYEKIV